LKVQSLGVGTPTPSMESWGSAFLVEHGADTLMFDCGPAATHKLVQAGYSPTDVDYLFLTHLHFDHTVDVPALLLTRWDQGGHYVQPLEVVGPTPTDRFIEDLIGPRGAFNDDIEARIGHPASQQVFLNRGGVLPRPRPQTNNTEIESGHQISGEGWRVTSGHAQHVQPYLDSLAFRLDTDYGSVVFTGDTEPCAEIEDLGRGADVLYSMCWDLQGEMKKAKEDTGQTGPHTAGQMASAAKVKKLVLVHHGPNLNSPENRRMAMEEASKTFDGEVIFADEGHVLEL